VTYSEGKSLALIPARAGSKGVPEKNLRRLGGITLTARAVRCAKATGLFDRIVVTTDGEPIAVEARREGAEVILRPEHLASDTANVVDVVAHTLDVLAGAGFSPVAVALLEPSCPLRTPAMVAAAMAALATADAILTVSAVPLRFHAVKQFCLDAKGYAYRVVGDQTPPVRRQDLPPTFIQNGAVYAFRPSMFQASRSLLGAAPKALIVTAPLVNIDTLEDLAEAERLLPIDPLAGVQREPSG
jgi:CMP-N-acetylneuraminic acid synthetase